MINITIKSQKNNISDVIIKGHANFCEFGNDIVCASVSSIVITTINAILRINDKGINYEVKDGYIHLKILKNELIINTLVINMIELLKELEQQYPENINLK